jgi:hypothetical protein
LGGGLGAELSFHFPLRNKGSAGTRILSDFDGGPYQTREFFSALNRRRIAAFFFFTLFGSLSW